MSQFRSSPQRRGPPYIRLVVVLVVVVAVIVALSMKDASKSQKRVEKVIPDSALAK